MLPALSGICLSKLVLNAKSPKAGTFTAALLKHNVIDDSREQVKELHTDAQQHS